jgi:hypothetical protein
VQSRLGISKKLYGTWGIDLMEYQKKAREIRIPGLFG